MVIFTFNANTSAANAGTTTYTITRILDANGLRDNTQIATYEAKTTPKTTTAGVVTVTETLPAETSNADGTKSRSISYGSKYSLVAASATDWQDGAATVAKYQWSTTNSGIVSVDTAKTTTDGDTANIEALSAGTATVKVEALNAAGKVVASTSYNFVVEKSSSNLVSVRYLNPIPTGKADQYLYAENWATHTAIENSVTAAQGYVDLDTLVNKSASLVVNASSSDITFKTEDASVATVDANGVVTAVGKGTTQIDVFVSATDTAKAEMLPITVKVATIAQDIITVKNGDTKVGTGKDKLDLDLSTSTAANAVKSAQLTSTSAAGNTDFTYALYSDAAATQAIAANGNDVASVSATGVVTAGTKAGKVYVKVSTKDNADKTIKGGNAIVEVEVNALPADTLTVDPVVVEINKTATVTPIAGNANAIFTYAVKAENDGENATIVTKSGNKFTGDKVGVATLYVTENATATTRATTVKTTITVVKELAKKDSDLTVANTSVVAKVGKTVELGAKATNAVTYTVADSSIATVSETGVVTAVKAGQTTVTVSAAGSDTMNAASITVPVVVTEDVKPVVVAKPAKVTGVKVANVKGAKVKVTVKAFNYKDGNVKQYGKASKAVSKKTDKK